MTSTLRAGKLPPGLLARLLAEHAAPVGAAADRLVVPPRLGEDAAVIELPDRYLVVATDPITFVSADLGHYAVTINANDVAVMGAAPRFFSCVLLLPEGSAEDEVERIFASLRQACAAADVAWIGGHTEVTGAVTHPVAVGQMIGEVEPEALVRKDALGVGDVLLLTKALAVEAVSIIARERADEVRSAHGAAFQARAAGFLHQPGIGVVDEALAACGAAGPGGVHAMHDPTEGGLAGALAELAAATGLGLEIEREAVPVSPEAAVLCEQFDLDVLGVIASGSLLIGVAPECAEVVREALAGAGCVAIGRAVEAPGCRFADGAPLPVFEVDEITKLF